MTTSTTEYTTEQIAEFETARAQKIASSKILVAGQSSIPFGIMDILYKVKETGITSKYTGTETEEGTVLFIMPFRTTRDLTRNAIYSIPGHWKNKYHRGQQVYPVIDQNGYVAKLLDAANMGNRNSFISQSQALAMASQQSSKEFDTKAVMEDVAAEAPVPTEQAEPKAEAPKGPAADGFESETNPF